MPIDDDSKTLTDLLIEFTDFIAKEVCCPDEEWENKHWSFQELACRKLVKLGFIVEEDGNYWYEEDT